MSWLWRASAVGGVALAAGCHHAPRVPVELTLLDELTAGTALTAAELLPLAERSWRCALDGEAGQTVLLAMRPTDIYRAAWVLEEEGRRAEYLALDQEGNVVMTAVAEYGDRALTVFKPPLLVAPATLVPGESRTAHCEMRVFDLDDTNRRREGGTATRTITYPGDQRLRTPFGEFVARRVEIVFTADLSMADVRDTATLYVVSGVGNVAEIERQEIRVLGVLPSVKERVLLLVLGGE